MQKFSFSNATDAEIVLLVYFTANIYTFYNLGFIVYMWISAVAQKIIQQRKNLLLSVVYNITYFFIVLLLLFSGTIKIIDPLPTIETIKAAFKFSDEINLLIATALPIVEIALAIMLLLKYKQRIILLTITVLFFFFFLFAVYGTVIGLNIDCGCFNNVVKSEFGITMILRNLILFLLMLFLKIISVNKLIEV